MLACRAINAGRPCDNSRPVSRRILLTCAVAAVFAAACGRYQTARQRDMVKTELEDDWKYWMTEYPELATQVGYPGQNARWTDYSECAMDRRAAYPRASGPRPAAIDRL